MTKNSRTTTKNEMSTITAASDRDAYIRANLKLIACGEESILEPESDHHDDDEEEECIHVPYMNLTKEERAQKSKKFNFGLCCDCDYGLEDTSEFVCRSGANGNQMMCNACHNYHMNLFEKSIGGEHGGCN